MSTEHFLIAGIIVVLGSLIQSTIGFGLAIIAAPILMWLDAALVPAPLLIIAMFLSALNAWRHRQHIVLGELSMAYLGRLPGTVIALMILTYMNQKQLMALVGFSVLFAVFISLGRWQVQARPSTLFAAGILSGFMGTSTSIGGPPIALVYQHATGQKIRANLSAFFTISCLISLLGLLMVNQLQEKQILYGLYLLPFAGLGFLIAGRLMPWIQGPWLRRSILTLCAISGAAAVFFSHK